MMTSDEFASIVISLLSSKVSVSVSITSQKLKKYAQFKYKRNLITKSRCKYSQFRSEFRPNQADKNICCINMILPVHLMTIVVILGEKDQTITCKHASTKIAQQIFMRQAIADLNPSESVIHQVRDALDVLCF